MRTILVALALTSVVAAAASPARAAKPGADLVQASLLADTDAAVPGGAFTLGVRLKMKPQWHTYWVNPGESGDATRIKLTGPAGFEFGTVQWPLPSKIDVPGGFSYGYEDEVLLLVPVKVSKDVAPGGSATIGADVKWLACHDTCIEGGAKLTIALPVAAEAKPANRELFDAWRERLPVAADQAPGSEAMAKVEQASGADGSPQPAITVNWKEPPRKVEWFPVSTAAVTIEDVVVNHDGRTTRIGYKPTLYKPDEIRGGRVEGVLVYEDAKGNRRGVFVPVSVAKAK